APVLTKCTLKRVLSTQWYVKVTWQTHQLPKVFAAAMNLYACLGMKLIS
ncbi:tat (twin-arginine translocation) pathway signal sequence domain protein, partial [Vibrio parahaemolyticus V-223/04]